MYEYCWDKARGGWKAWLDPADASAAAAGAAIPETAAFNEIIVPTGEGGRGLGAWLQVLAGGGPGPRVSPPAPPSPPCPQWTRCATRRS